MRSNFYFVTSLPFFWLDDSLHGCTGPRHFCNSSCLGILAADDLSLLFGGTFLGAAFLGGAFRRAAFLGRLLGLGYGANWLSRGLFCCVRCVATALRME